MNTMQERVAASFLEAKRKTFREARQELLDYLRSKGWKVDTSYKLPQATSPRGDVRAYFKSEAVYYSVGENLSFKNSWSMGADIRQVAPERFEKFLLDRADEAAVQGDATLESLKSTPWGDHGFTQEEIAIMGLILSLKSGARAEEMERYNLGPYSVRNPHIDKLMRKGLIKARGKSLVLNRKKAMEVLKLHGKPPLYRSQFPYGIAASQQVALRVAAKWESKPKGWTDESRKKFWNSLTGGVKHKVTKCMKQMEGKVDDPGAFCASLADRVEGKGWRSGD